MANQPCQEFGIADFAVFPAQATSPAGRITRRVQRLLFGLTPVFTFLTVVIGLIL